MKQLLFSLTKKDFEVDTFRSGGKGGQHQNKTESGVRIRHAASGAIGESREHREQGRNKKAAFERLVKSPLFQAWHKMTCARMLGQTKSTQELNREVDNDMTPDKLKIGYY